jgi:hypothetical protein
MKVLQQNRVTPPPYTETHFQFEVDGYPDGWEYSIRVYDDGSYTIHNHLGIELFLSTDFDYSEDEEFANQILEYMGL